jgi:hypothetical protein
MRSRFAAIVAALVLSVSTAAQAEIYTLYTSPTPSASTSPSTLGVTISLLGGLVSIAIPPVAITGTAVIDMNLDSTDSGPLYVNSTALSLANAAGNLNTILGPVSYSLTGVGFSITAGPLTVTDGSFSITSATPGSLTLNTGLITLVALGQNLNVDLSEEPLVLEFSSLGAIVISGRADDSNLVGSDLVDANAHTLGAPGLTGLSEIDTDGSEIFINLAGASITTDISGLEGTITLTGAGVSVGVPEAGTVLMMGMASSVVGLMVVRRRRNG